MDPLTKDCTTQQRADLAIAIAQHAHLKLCDFCALALAEITTDVEQAWSRQTLNALAHRCQEAERLAEVDSSLQDLTFRVTTLEDPHTAGDE